jgi:heme-degrading monooxygenase HmoA
LRAMPTAIPDPYYMAFIDEAGDPGLKAVRPIDPAGATEWLCLSAVLIKARQNADVASWVRSILTKANIRHPDLHYRYLSDAQKRIAVNEIAKLPVRAFVLASNKKNMRGYRNARAETVQSKQWFYNFCLRLLLERVTHYCYQHAVHEHAKGRFVKLIYSERAVHSFAQTAAYHELLKTQARGGTLFLQKRRIVSEVLDWRLTETVSHKSSAGAQLADVVVSPEAGDYTLYASHTVWKNRATFEAWTKSEAFRAAHSRAGDNKPLYLDHPQFEGFETIQTVKRSKPEVA